MPDPASTYAALDAFFDNYEARTRDALMIPPSLETEAITHAFADFFVEAGPKGVSGGRNDAQFARMVPQGFQFYRRIGTTAMRILARNYSEIDPQHWLARLHWQADYLRENGEAFTLEFEVVYLLQLGPKGPKIFAYITGDEEALYREHDIRPWRKVD